MASTNKTTNYELSQYIGTDKPTYLSDYNGDMYKIDAQMKTNADNIATAISSASTATSTANSALSTAQSAESTANSASSTATSASTTAGNAQSTANSALSTASAAQSTANQVATDLNAFENTLNFTSFESYSQSSDFSGFDYCTFSSGTLRVASNSDGSIGKVYGEIVVNSDGTHAPKVRMQSNLRPSSNITINEIGFSAHGSYTTPTLGVGLTLNISTTGEVEVVCNWSDSNSKTRFYVVPCLLLLSDFGDTPTPPES